MLAKKFKYANDKDEVLNWAKHKFR
jgi:hypothetical protein